MADTRRFTTPRRRCDDDYDGPRVCHLGLGFILYRGAITKFRSHDVIDPHDSAKRYELWSPNAELTVVFPGIAPEGFSLEPPLSNPRFDGSGGQWDFTLNPQYLEPGKFHRAFIRRTTSYSGMDDFPEFWPLTSHWESCATSSENMGLPTAFVLENLKHRTRQLLHEAEAIKGNHRKEFKQYSYLLSETPRVPSADWFQAFYRPHSWELHVDRIVFFQRQLKELAAWVEYAKRLVETKFSIHGPCKKLQQQEFPPADERYLGAWIEGNNEAATLWLLGLGIPCYFVHTYRENIDYGEFLALDRRNFVISDFIPQVTPIHLSPEHNPYFRLALDQQAPISSSSAVVIPHTFPSVHAPHEDMLNLSCSWVQDLRGLAQNPMTGTITWPTTYVGPDRIPWIRPPPVLAGDKTKTWAWYRQVDIDGQLCMQATTKRGKGSAWYDRENCRILHFENLSSVPGLIDSPTSIYGRPAPFFSYIGVEPQGKRRGWVPRSAKRTVWIYSTQYGPDTPVPDQAPPKPKKVECVTASPSTPTSETSEPNEPYMLTGQAANIASSSVLGNSTKPTTSTEDFMDVDMHEISSTRPTPSSTHPQGSELGRPPESSCTTSTSEARTRSDSIHATVQVGTIGPVRIRDGVATSTGISEASLPSNAAKNHRPHRFTPYSSSSRPAESSKLSTSSQRDDSLRSQQLPRPLVDALASSTGPRKAALQLVISSFHGGHYPINTYLCLDVSRVNDIVPPLLSSGLDFGTFVISCKTGFYLRYWHLVYPDLPFMTLIYIAVQRGLQLRLTVKTSDIRGMISTLLRPPPPPPEVYPHGILPDGLAKWSHKRKIDSNRRACTIYMQAVRNVLQLPRARRLILEGGLLWRIALQWDGSTALYNLCLHGPSPLALHHRIGETHPDLELFDDGLPHPMINILLGVQDNGLSLWPSPSLLEHCTRWYGLWNDDLEVWFQKHASAITTGDAKPLSKTDWRKFFKAFRVAERNNADVVGSEAHAERLCGQLENEFPELWSNWTSPYSVIFRDPVACPFNTQDVE